MTAVDKTFGFWLRYGQFPPSVDTRFSYENRELRYPALESGMSPRGGRLPTIRCAGREWRRLYWVKGFRLPLRDGVGIVGGVRFAG